jgi:uncharacterized integral membrane protein
MRVLRIVKYIILAVIAVILALLCFANSMIVELRLIPAGLVGWVGRDYAISLPLFLVVLGGVAIGLFVGYILEWLRETRHRVEARTQRRAAKRLEHEVKTLKKEKDPDRDEILALIEDGRS